MSRRKRDVSAWRSDRTRAAVRRRLADLSALEMAAEMFHVTGDATRLRLLYVLKKEQPMPVAELACRLGLSSSRISESLAALRMHGLIVARREAQNLYYGWTDHSFLETLSALVFEASSSQPTSPSGPGRKRNRPERAVRSE